MTDSRWDALAMGLAGLCLAIFTWHVSHHWFSTVDTEQLLVGVGVADGCLHHEVFTNCNAAGLGDVSHFPLLQYLPALLMKRLGAGIQTAYQGLCWLNAVAFAGLLALLWHTGRRTGGRAAGALLCLAGAASPLLWYSHAGFGEVLAAAAAALFIASVVLRWHPVLTAVALAFAALSKEPSVVILVALAAVVIAARPAGERWSRGELAAIGAGVLVAIALTAGFNVFRYGTLRNQYYLDDAVHPPLLDRPLAFAAMFVAPNVGLLWFWPMALGTGALAVAGSGGRRRRLVWLVLGLFAVVVAGLASFWGPFGWEAWGPRHLMPWVPCFLIALAGVAGDGLARALPSPRVLLALTAVVALLAVPQVAAFRDWPLGFALFDPGPACAIHLPDVHEYRKAFGGTAGYYACLRRQAWTAPPTLAHAVGKLDPAGAAWAAVLVASILAVGRAALVPAQRSPTRSVVLGGY